MSSRRWRDTWSYDSYHHCIYRMTTVTFIFLVGQLYALPITFLVSPITALTFHIPCDAQWGSCCYSLSSEKDFKSLILSIANSKANCQKRNSLVFEHLLSFYYVLDMNLIIIILYDLDCYLSIYWFLTVYHVLYFVHAGLQQCIRWTMILL